MVELVNKKMMYVLARVGPVQIKVGDVVMEYLKGDSGPSHREWL